MKVAIIGTAPGSRAVGPYGDPSWKIWACSQGNQGQLPRVDAWFELHSLTSLTGQEYQDWVPGYVAWLRAQTFPIYMQEKNDLVPGAIVFPIKRMIELLRANGAERNWMTSSVSYMMLYAISLGATDIGLFGVDMAAAEEHYTLQRAGIWRIIEICKAKGINVHIPHESDMGQPAPLYAYGEATLMGRKLYHRLHELETHRAALAAQRDKLQAEVCFFDGAINNVKWMVRTFIDGEDIAMVSPAMQPEAPPEPVKRAAMTGEFTEVRESGLIVPPHKQKQNGGASKPPAQE